MIKEDDGSFGEKHPYPGDDLNVVEKLNMAGCQSLFYVVATAVDRSIGYFWRDRVLTLVK